MLPVLLSFRRKVALHTEDCRNVKSAKPMFPFGLKGQMAQVQEFQELGVFLSSLRPIWNRFRNHFAVRFQFF